MTDLDNRLLVENKNLNQEFGMIPQSKQNNQPDSFSLSSLAQSKNKLSWLQNVAMPKFKSVSKSLSSKVLGKDIVHSSSSQEYSGVNQTSSFNVTTRKSSSILGASEMFEVERLRQNSTATGALWNFMRRNKKFAFALFAFILLWAMYLYTKKKMNET